MRVCSTGKRSTYSRGYTVDRLVVVGDSIAFGQFVHPHKTWVHLLSEAAPIPIDNFSWCGDTTRIALEHSMPMVQRDGCSLAYVQLGLNDANQWETDHGQPRVSRDAYTANMSEIVARLKACGARRVIVGTNHTGPNYDDTLGKFDVVQHPKSDVLADGVHLSEDGHRKYFERIRAALGW